MYDELEEIVDQMLAFGLFKF